MKYHFFDRLDKNDMIAGITVSKNPVLPERDIILDEYVWHAAVALWFVRNDRFTEQERFEAYQEFLKGLIV